MTASPIAQRPLAPAEKELGLSVPVAMPAWKRAMDLVGASIGLALLSPLLVLLSVAIVTESHGGPIYRQLRVGKGGAVFRCWKFRSMHRGADQLMSLLRDQNEATGHIFKMKDDPRRTRVGRWLRRTSLDELPQLWNVLRGDMSLVGPRPPTIDEVLAYDDHSLGRLAVTPGMTGLWQVTLRSDGHNFFDMVDLDLAYARHISLWTDVKVLLKTIPTVVMGRGSY